MNKKLVFLALLIFGSVNAALFAQISVGAGGNFTANFDSHFLTDAGAESPNTHLLGGGFYVFLDAAYVEADVGLLFGNWNSDKSDSGEHGMGDKGLNITALKLGLFGKYPIALGDAGAKFFPMLGIDGQIWLAGNIDGENIEDSTFKEKMGEAFSQFWVKAGLGFDVPIAERVYFRIEALYGIRFNTKDENETLKDTKTYSAIVGHGADIRLAIGYKF